MEKRDIVAEYRFRLYDDEVNPEILDINNYADLQKIKYADTSDDYASCFSVGNKLTFPNLPGVYKIEKVLAQNLFKEVYIEVDCKKFK